MESGFSTSLVAGVTGLSARKLDYYDRTGLVHPDINQAAGSGSRRIYSFRNIVELKAVARLRDTLSLQKIRRSLEYLREHLPKIDQPLASLKFLTDGVSIFVLTDDSQVLLDTLNSGQLIISIALGEFIEETRNWARTCGEASMEQVFVDGDSYTIDIVPSLEDGGFVVTCRELKGAISQGETRDEAREMIIDAISLVREVLAETQNLKNRKIHGA